MPTASTTSSRWSRPNRWLDAQLGLCFCDHCRAGAKKAGIDADGLRARVRADIESYLAADIDLPDDMAEAFWLATRGATASSAQFLAWRCTVVTSLVTEIRAAVRKDAAVAVIPSVARPTGGAWYEGTDLRALAWAAGIVEACFYEPSAARVLADAWDVKRRIGNDGAIRGIMRAAHPDLNSAGEVAAAVAGPAQGRHRRHRLLQLRLLPPAELRLDPRGARRDMTRHGFHGKGRRHHRRGGRHRPGTVRATSRRWGRRSAPSTGAESVKDFARDLAREGVGIEPAIADIGDEAAVGKAFAKLTDALGVGRCAHQQRRHLARLESQEDHVGRSGATTSTTTSTAPTIAPPRCSPACRRRASGAIVNIGSVNGLSTFGDPAYSAAKAGMVSLTQSMAMEYGRYGIRVNIVCPGTVRTPIWQHRVDREPEIHAKLAKWYPLGRVAEPMDIAKAVAFLASDDAAAITGVVLPVDCGLTAGNIVMSRELTLEEF